METWSIVKDVVIGIVVPVGLLIVGSLVRKSDKLNDERHETLKNKITSQPGIASVNAGVQVVLKQVNKI